MNINKINQAPIEHVTTPQNPHTAHETAVRREDVHVRNGKQEISEINIHDLAETLNSAAKSVNRRMAFSVNDKTNRVVIKVINTENNEVIREIPSKELIRVYEHIHDMIGLFVDEAR
ncbi:MAG TPA: flagellar protein FlaG [Spirochaetota bacterium]|nr:flagellar protein FlaG [Spirochaetota bacterium]HPQ52494.1 flagellar protein FlaG [Spirochaetota bacterium]